MAELPENREIDGVLLRGASMSFQERVAARGWRMIETTDPYVALAELCRCGAAHRARSAWGLAPTSDLVLIVTHDALDRDALMTAAHRHVGAASIWEDDGTELRVEIQGDATASIDAPDEHPAPRDVVSSDEDDSRITPDEISMLLEAPPTKPWPESRP